MKVTREIFGDRRPLCTVCDRVIEYGEQAGSTSYGDAVGIPIELLTCLDDAGLRPPEETVR